MADAQSLNWKRGQAVTGTLTMTPSTNVTGWTASLYVSLPGNLTPILTLSLTVSNASTGVFTFALTAAQTAAIAGGTYAFAAWRTDSGSETPLAWGTLDVDEIPRP